MVPAFSALLSVDCSIMVVGQPLLASCFELFVASPLISHFLRFLVFRKTTFSERCRVSPPMRNRRADLKVCASCACLLMLMCCVAGDGKKGKAKKKTQKKGSDDSVRRANTNCCTGPSDIFKIVRMIMERHYEPVIIFSFSKRGVFLCVCCAL